MKFWDGQINICYVLSFTTELTIIYNLSASFTVRKAITKDVVMDTKMCLCIFQLTDTVPMGKFSVENKVDTL